MMRPGEIYIFSIFSVRTELLEQGAISRLAISSADIRHSGVYTCAVSDNISQSLRLYIIDGTVYLIISLILRKQSTLKFFSSVAPEPGLAWFWLELLMKKLGLARSIFQIIWDRKILLM